MIQCRNEIRKKRRQFGETDLQILLVVTIISCVVCCVVFFVAISLAFVLTASAYHKHRMAAMRKFIDCPKKVAKDLLSRLTMEDEDEDEMDRFDYHHHPAPKKATVLMRSSTAEELPAIVIEADTKVIEMNSSDPIEVTMNGGEVLSGSVSTITPSIVLHEVVENESVDKFEEADAFDASKEEDEDDNTEAAHDDDHRSAILHCSSKKKAQTNQPHSNSPSPKPSVEFTLTQRTAFSEAVSGSDNLSMQLARETTPSVPLQTATPSPLSSNPQLPSEKLLSPSLIPINLFLDLPGCFREYGPYFELSNPIVPMSSLILEAISPADNNLSRSWALLNVRLKC
ncbi:hypothetical protein BLNAU_13247 [Blattamonas nauphoetae]|uniref:Uncharacterized protein n=1 Tax=Blattamonas nauphoetae TaxID=2049346 RepID=A0ABQ9XHF0_9EUKA|nr:hypothetical protein BLNAU_13247 [Blattamonas nauphoetae]